MPASKQKQRAPPEPLCPSLFPERGCFTRGGRASVYDSLRPNHLDGAYLDGADYLRRHAELLRADFCLSLVDQVRDFRSSWKKDNHHKHAQRQQMQQEQPGEQATAVSDRVYRVRLGKEAADQDGKCRRVYFLDKERTARIDWSEEKRLLFGSLVLLSRNKFRTFDMALVRERPPRLEVEGVRSVSKYGRFLTCTLEGYDKRAKGGGVTLMMEAEAFYFPYFHVVERLRRMPLDAIPFREEIVGCKPQRVMPQYLKDAFPGQQRVPDSYLDALRGELSASQMEAVKSVLSSRVALVQGPPGTGKTHVAVNITKLLLSLRNINKKASPGQRGEGPVRPAPVLLITTTRHAVREFLKRCLAFTNLVLHARGPLLEDEKDKQEEVATALQEEYNNCLTPHTRQRVMRKADVLAMTTTRATYTRSLLDQLRVEVVIVEEAAEALEPFIISSIPTTAQHLILLGDQKQLRPSTAHHVLASRYRLNVSLLERLVDNGFPCTVLSEQRRMRPEIARLVGHIYPSLTNHLLTYSHPTILGVGANVFFINHDYVEEEKNGNPSHANYYEARIMVALTRYLLFRGYSPENITILTTYKRQEHVIRSMLGTECEVRVSSVDGFQGEENHIILLSLVRGNEAGSVGFLKMENRVCVALSRAKHGLYIVGNMTTLLAGDGASVWGSVCRELRRQEALGPALPLVCPHQGSFQAASAEAIRKAQSGCVLCRLECTVSAAAAESQDAASRYFALCKVCHYSDADSARQLAALSLEYMRASAAVRTAVNRLRLANQLLSEGAIDVNVDSESTVDLVIKMKGLSV